MVWYHNLTFQSNCKNCGGPLPAAGEKNASSDPGEALPTPPLAPRPIPTGTPGGWYPGMVGRSRRSSLVSWRCFQPCGSRADIGCHYGFFRYPFSGIGLAFLAARCGCFFGGIRTPGKLCMFCETGKRGRANPCNRTKLFRQDQRALSLVIRYQFQADGRI